VSVGNNIADTIVPRNALPLSSQLIEGNYKTDRQSTRESICPDGARACTRITYSITRAQTQVETNPGPRFHPPLKGGFDLGPNHAFNIGYLGPNHAFNMGY